MPDAGRRAGGASRAKAARPAFVIQEHHARALHWDFRLERDGVLVSWALPKGLPMNPKKNHLAVQTEDHPMEYASFAGEIPKGEYGGGHVEIWDRGWYECEKWNDREVMVVLHGTRAEGKYVLFKTGSGPRGWRGGGGQNSWMIHRMDPAPSGWQPLPDKVRPMLCRPSDLPAKDQGWAFEFKWDGARALLFVDGGRIRIVSRNDRDVTVSYPELRGLGESLGSHQVLLDGEIVALDEAGRPSFSLLQQRMHVGNPAAARRLAQRVPVDFMAFDVLHLDGRDTTRLPYTDRRRLLEGLGLDGPNWATPPAFIGTKGRDVMAAAEERGLEGVVAKRVDSQYLAGARSDAWLKVKRFRTQDVVIGGWTPGNGHRSDQLGALLLGVPDVDGLHYAGKVGSGFSEVELDRLLERLRKIERDDPPFVGSLPRSQVQAARWVKPRLVGEVRFSEWTREGRLRQSSWRGLRDMRPDEVRRES